MEIYLNILTFKRVSEKGNIERDEEKRNTKREAKNRVTDKDREINNINNTQNKIRSNGLLGGNE